jgi:hypothetical protein
MIPDPMKPFIVESDASKFATGGVLKQQDMNGDWHPCGFISHTFDATQRNYDIYDRELLGIIRALETWRHFLQGSPHPVMILSDHKNLTYFRTVQKLNHQQARWSLLLSQYDLKLVHVPGSKMIISDALFVRTVDMELREEILKRTHEDSLSKDAIKALKQGGPPPIKSTLLDWREEDGLLFFKERCVVPANEDLRRKIVQRYHDALPMGHPGQYKTLELLRRDYWWPGMYVFVKNYVSGCATCQQMKINTHPSTPALQPIKSTVR